MSETTVIKQTVFIANLSFKTKSKDLGNFLGAAGKVLKVFIVRQGRRSLGYGFASFSSLEEAEKAAKELSGKELDGREEDNKEISGSNQKENVDELPARDDSIKEKTKETAAKDVSTKEAPKDISTKDSSSKDQVNDEGSEPSASIFVANLPFRAGVSNLYSLFKNYNVTYAMIARQKSRNPGRRGRSKGYGFVELESVEEQQRVLKEFGTVELKGRPIHIRAATSQKKNSVRRRKPSSQENDKKVEKSEEKPKKTRKRRNNRKKQEEAVDSVKQAEEAVKEVKKEDGVRGWHQGC
ncbi:hypothetical protein G6F54_008251 [Rhizopus delemar]|nr:hypothetical protein G6F54_008251 [Rhizopus delemar]